MLYFVTAGQPLTVVPALLLQLLMLLI
jgi:hypothetical protein